VAKVWLGQPGKAEQAVLDDAKVPAITPGLDPAGRITGTPHRLAANTGFAYIGSFVNGIGFVVNPEEAAELCKHAPTSREVLSPYLNGQDLNSTADQSARRLIIDFGSMSLVETRRYPACLRRIEQLVKPDRDRLPAYKARVRDAWWRFEHQATTLYEAIEGLDRVLAIALVSKVVMPVFQSTGQVFSHMLGVFATDDAADLALLSSAPHYWWAIARASTMKGDLRYTPSDVFETLARPELTGRMRVAGERLDTYRRELMLDRNEGLTKTYNRVHDSAERATDIAELRAIHVEIDHAVTEAYGWHDLTLDHDFHETRQGVRWTVGPTVRQEILDRLLELNFARYADEEKRGLHNKGKPKRGGPAKIPKPRSSAETTALPFTWG
jgi:hypothetical protein